MKLRAALRKIDSLQSRLADVRAVADSRGAYIKRLEQRLSTAEGIAHGEYLLSCMTTGTKLRYLALCLRYKALVVDLWRGGEALWRRVDAAERETRRRALERAVVEKLPRCATDDCGKLATRPNPEWGDDCSMGWCDEHASIIETDAVQLGVRVTCVGNPYPWADAVRALEKACPTA